MEMIRKWMRRRNDFNKNPSQKLGSGVGGSVYLGSYDEKTVAIKEFKDRDEAIREARNFLLLSNHPSICHFYGICLEEPGPACLLLDYIDGFSMDRMESQARFDLIRNGSRFTNFCLSFCKVLLHMHSLSVVHADLSARNLMMTKDGQLKLVDLGLAHHVTTGDLYQIDPTLKKPLPVRWTAPEGQNERKKQTFLTLSFQFSNIPFHLLLMCGRTRSLCGKFGREKFRMKTSRMEQSKS
jgi:serine/threonine protein kinase